MQKRALIGTTTFTLAADEQSDDLKHDFGVDDFLMVPILEAKCLELARVLVFSMLGGELVIGRCGRIEEQRCKHGDRESLSEVILVGDVVAQKSFEALEGILDNDTAFYPAFSGTHVEELLESAFECDELLDVGVSIDKVWEEEEGLVADDLCRGTSAFGKTFEDGTAPSGRDEDVILNSVRTIAEQRAEELERGETGVKGTVRSQERQ